MSKKNLTAEQKARKAARSKQIHGASHQGGARHQGPSQVAIECGQLSKLLEQVARHDLHDAVKEIVGLSKGMTQKFCANADTVDANTRKKLLVARDQITARIPQNG